MKLIAYFIVSIFLNSSGQLLLKKGMLNISKNLTDKVTLGRYLLEIAHTPQVTLGLAFYTLSLFIWLQILTKADVSLAYPIIISLTFIIVTIGASILLGESITFFRIIGIVLIIIGVFFIAKS